MTTLPRSTPHARGIDAAGVSAFLDAIEQRGIELHSLILLRDGDVVVQGWWAPYDRAGLNLLYSLSKSFVSVAAGIAIDEGRFELDDRVLDHFADLAPAEPAEQWRDVTVRHCLTMSTGHLVDPPIAGDDWLVTFLATPPERPPGTVFTYNQMATHTVARLIERTAGERVVDYLRPRLFDPLGIGPARWLTGPGGHDAGFSGLHLQTEGLASLGQLLLQRGRWEGSELVPAWWVDLATQVQMPNDGAYRRTGDAPEPGSDWGRGYGFQFWKCREGFRGDGAFGQFCLVLPDQRSVLALTAEAPDMQAVLDEVWRHLLPALNGPGSPAADEALTGRLTGLALPIVDDDGSGPDRVEFRREGGDAAPWVHTLEVALDGAQHLLRFSTDGQTWTLPVGAGTWERGLWRDDDGCPVVGSGGWHAGRFHAQLRVIRTPHTLLVDADPHTGRASLGWSNVPLHGSDPAHSSLCHA